MTNSTSQSSTPGRTRTPPTGPFFWATMLLAVTAGQTASDTLNGRLDLNRSGTLMVAGALMVVALVVIFVQKRYVPWSYWATVAVCSMLGNALEDYLLGHVRLNSLSAAAALFAVALIAVLALWYALEHTLSVQAIVTARQETLYWIAFVLTLAFGTSFSDVLSDRLGIGASTTTVLFAAIVCAIAFAHYRLGLKAVPAFWLGFIFMQPMTYALGDLISQPGVHGGLGAGPLATSVLLFVLIAVLILYEMSRGSGDRSA